MGLTTLLVAKYLCDQYHANYFNADLPDEEFLRVSGNEGSSKKPQGLFQDNFWNVPDNLARGDPWPAATTYLRQTSSTNWGSRPQEIWSTAVPCLTGIRTRGRPSGSISWRMVLVRSWDPGRPRFAPSPDGGQRNGGFAASIPRKRAKPYGRGQASGEGPTKSGVRIGHPDISCAVSPMRRWPGAGASGGRQRCPRG